MTAAILDIQVGSMLNLSRNATCAMHLTDCEWSVGTLKWLCGDARWMGVNEGVA